jgi:hypothetical protein
MYKEIKIKNTWIHYGGSFKRFAIGLSIDRYSISLDLVWIWITIER